MHATKRLILPVREGTEKIIECHYPRWRGKIGTQGLSSITSDDAAFKEFDSVGGLFLVKATKLSGGDKIEDGG